MRYLVLMIVLLSFLNSANLKRNSSVNVVVDSTNNLMWMDGEENVKLYFTHEEAEDYCTNLKFAGYKGWRLPSLEEFETIVDKKRHPLYINKAFKFSDNTGYWADKAHWRTFWFYADYMHFVSGTPYFDSRHKKKQVRCVRNSK